MEKCWRREVEVGLDKTVQYKEKKTLNEPHKMLMKKKKNKHDHFLFFSATDLFVQQEKESVQKEILNKYVYVYLCTR